MKIGILGAGPIGATLTQRLSAAGHDVKVANSRGPETIPPEALASGGRATHADAVVRDIDVLIMSVPLGRIPALKPLISGLTDSTVVLDTSNYYPFRDGVIESIENGQPESLFVVEQIGRPIVKAWNAITANSFRDKDTEPGDPGRIAIPVAADSKADRQLGMRLVEETGFDAFDSGVLAESWRQQPGAPAYCTDLTRDQMPEALAAAKATRSPKRRDLAWYVITQLTEDDPTADRGPDFFVRVNRLIHN